MSSAIDPSSGPLRAMPHYQKSVTANMEWGGSVLAGTSPGIIWELMPAGKTTWLHQTSTTLTGDATKLADLTDRRFVRLFTSIQVAGAASDTLIGVDYSLNNADWTNLGSLTIGDSTGAKDSGWLAIPALARGLVYLRLYGENGDGAASPRFSPPTLVLK